jgi:surface antigen
MRLVSLASAFQWLLAGFTFFLVASCFSIVSAAPPIPYSIPGIIGDNNINANTGTARESAKIQALRALSAALNRLGDGSTYIWRRDEQKLRGLVTPTTSFRNSHGKICRHVVYTISRGKSTRRMEGIACRNADRRWSLSG